MFAVCIICSYCFIHIKHQGEGPGLYYHCNKSSSFNERKLSKIIQNVKFDQHEGFIQSICYKGEYYVLSIL